MLFSCLLAQEGNAETVNWYIPDWQPYIIQDGPLKGDGFTQKMLREIIKELPKTAAKHEVIAANFKRILVEVARDDRSCSALLVKTPERSQHIEFSEPYVLLPGNGFIFSNSDRPLFSSAINDKGEIALEKLWAIERLKIAVNIGRTYGPTIDSFLQNERTKTQIVAIAHNVGLQTALKMINKGRITASLGQQLDLSYSLKTMRLGTAFTWLPIANSIPYFRGRLACPKSDWGRAMIENLNPILRRIRTRPEFYRHLRMWIPDDRFEKYQQSVDDVFGN